ncbi:GEA2 [Candida margitis]|uniref:GEA2 n=1 Tax=Candida margitis TaxID=1775924 RepID=UPI00222712A5|nr:GEA2 [Candida margitis]KAI5967367.1 GEA2 [Candida margitis]
MELDHSGISNGNGISKWKDGYAISIDPITLTVNECMIMVSAMRRSNRWASGGVSSLFNAGDFFGTREEDDTFSDSLDISSILNNHSSSYEKSVEANSVGGGMSKHSQGNPLLSSFLQLRSILLEAQNIYDVDSLTILQPFLLVIKSSSTSGFVTGLALNSISKFITYGVISAKSKNLQNSLIQIVSSLTHCRFEAAEQSSDDAVLLRVLRLLEKLMESPLAILLTDDSVSEIVQTSLSLACNKKRSEVLRRGAEMSLVSISVVIFSRLRDIEPDKEIAIDLQTNFSETKLPEDTIGGTLADNIQANVSQEQITVNKDLQEEQTLQNKLEPSFGIKCINEFLGILVSIISPSNQYQHMESTRVFALSLINTAVEVAGSQISKHLSLLTMIADPVSKHILQIITTTESSALLKPALQLFSTVSIVLGKELKPQFELSMILVSQSILPRQKNNTKDQAKSGHLQSRSPVAKELLLESLSLLWSRSPTFFTELFVEYDCNFDKSNLAVDTIKFLCQLSLPESALNTTVNVPPLCLEGVLHFLNGVNERSKTFRAAEEESSVNEYIEKQLKKSAFIRCTEVINKSPKEGIKLLAKENFISDEKDVGEVASFFFTKAGRLDKKMLGEFLAKPSNADLLQHFIRLFDFEGLRVDEALRVLLKTFRLPGESQQIERIVETFAQIYIACQKDGLRESKPASSPDQEGGAEPEEDTSEAVKPDKDSVFILSYSIIMLNTDLHNPQVKRQMLLDDYKRNLRGTYNGKDFPEWYLAKIYSSIKDREIIMPEEHHGTEKWFDDVWHNLISTQDFTQIEHVKLEKTATCEFDKELFTSVFNGIVDMIMTIYKEASDDHVLTRLMSSLDKIFNICLTYDMEDAIDDLTCRLVESSNLAKTTLQKVYVDDNIRPEIPITQMKIEGRKGDLFVSDLSVWFGRNFKAQLAAVMLFRLMKKTNCKITKSWNKVIEVIANLFENCLIDPNVFVEFQKKIQLGPLPKVPPVYVIKKAKVLNNSGLLSTFSSFLKGYSDDPPEPTDIEIESTISTMDCLKSLNVANIFSIISKSESANLQKFIHLLLAALPEHSDEVKRSYEAETLFILETCVCFCLLLNDEHLSSLVLGKLDNHNLSGLGELRLVAYKLLLLRYCKDESVLVATIKQAGSVERDIASKHGTQIVSPLMSLTDEDSWCCKTLLKEESYWNTMRFYGSLQAYAFDIIPFLETLIKSPQREISPENFLPILGLLDEISSLGAIGSQYECENAHSTVKNANDSYYREVVALAKKSIDLTSSLAVLSKEDNFEKRDLFYSTVQALAHQCFNPCREVREYSVKALSVTVLSFEADDNVTFSGIFEFGLFPLLAELTKPDVFQGGSNGFDKTFNEIFRLLCKVFLKQVDKSDVDTISKVWLELLDYLEKFHSSNSRSLTPEITESSSESLKNLLLVLQTNEFLSESNPDIVQTTKEKVEKLFPHLSEELNVQSGGNTSSEVDEESK